MVSECVPCHISLSSSLRSTIARVIIAQVPDGMLYFISQPITPTLIRCHLLRTRTILYKNFDDSAPFTTHKKFMETAKPRESHKAENTFKHYIHNSQLSGIFVLCYCVFRKGAPKVPLTLIPQI